MRLVILGAGGYGRTIQDTAQQLGRYDSVFFLDDNSEASDVKGKCLDFPAFIDGETEFYPAFGNNAGRLSWIRRLKDAGARIATLCHPSAYVSPRVKIGEGTVILPKAAVNTDCVLQEGVIINLGALVDHGCIVGAGAHICVGAIVKAENRIPDLMKVEAGEVIMGRSFPI